MLWLCLYRKPKFYYTFTASKSEVVIFYIGKLEKMPVENTVKTTLTNRYINETMKQL